VLKVNLLELIFICFLLPVIVKPAALAVNALFSSLVNSIEASFKYLGKLASVVVIVEYSCQTLSLSLPL
jgi:hypothetical protein